MMENKRTISQIIQEIKSEIHCISKAAKASEQMFANLARKDYNDMTWVKPDTPDMYKPIKQQAMDKRDQLYNLRKLRKEGKIQTYAFRSIDRDTRQKVTDSKKVLPTLNEFGAPPKFWNAKNSRFFFSTLERGSLEEKRRLRDLAKLEEGRYEYELQTNPGMRRNNSMINMTHTLDASQSLLQQPAIQIMHNTGDEDDDDDEDGQSPNHNQDIQQQMIENANHSRQNQSNQQQVYLTQQVNTSLQNQSLSMTKSQSLPDLKRSQIHPYLMNLKFSRQGKRKPLAANDVHEKRFESCNLLPVNLSKNKKLVREIKMDKYKERDFRWMSRFEPALDYNLVDVEKYKYKKTMQPYIMQQHTPNRNHQRGMFLGRKL